MANWTPEGFIGKMLGTIAKHIAPSGMPSPLLWGDEVAVCDRFQQGVSALKLTRRLYRFEYPFAPHSVVDFFRLNYGPMTRAFASLDLVGQEDLRRELIDLWSGHNQAEDLTTRVDAEYLEVVATRGIR